METRLRGMLLVGGAAVTWSTGGLLARLVTDTDRWTTIFWRSASAFAFLLVFLLITNGRDTPALFRRMGLAGLAVGLCFACASISLVIALSYTSVAKTLVIMSATPLIAALFGLVFLGERILPLTWITIAAVMAGIAIMVSGSMEQGSLIGDFFALLIAVSYAGAIVISRRHHTVGMAPAATLGVVIAFAISAFLATPGSVTAHDLPVIFLFGAGQLGIGLALFVTGVRLIPAAHSALLAMLEPILGPVWVWLVLSERPAAATFVGGTIVIVSVGLKTLLDLRAARESPVTPA